MTTKEINHDKLGEWALTHAIPMLKSIQKNAAFYKMSADTNEDKKRFEAIHKRATTALNGLIGKD